MSTLPKNITLITYKNKDRNKQIKYQVQKTIKGKKYTKLFDDLNSAQEYLNEVNSYFGRKGITEYDLLEQKKLDDFKKANFKYYFDLYFEYKNPPDYDKINLLKHKAYLTYKSFFRTILNTKINVYYEEMIDETPQAIQLMIDTGLGNAVSRNTTLGQLKLHEVNYKVINAYIKARLALKKSKITVRKELSIINCFFNELRYVDSVSIKISENLNNPCKEYDKRLLKNAYNTQKAKRIDASNFENYLNCIYAIKDWDFIYTSLIQYFGALRMSEAINLTWEQIDFKGKTINLPITKTTPRIVYMHKDLQDLFETIEPIVENRVGRILKKQSLYKYQKATARYRDRFNFKINTHQFRKDAISRMIDNVGDNPIVLAQILGFKNVAQFRTDYIQDNPNLNTLKGVMNNVGHADTSINTTNKSYYELPKIDK